MVFVTSSRLATAGRIRIRRSGATNARDRRSRDDVVDDGAGHVGEPEIAPAVPVGELRVIDPEQVENRRVQIVHVHRPVDGLESEIDDSVNVSGRLNGDVGLEYKVQGVVRLPLGVQASASLDAREGAHRLRTRNIPSSLAGQSSTTIILQPRGELGRLPSVTILDARLQKDVSFGHGARLTVFLDALNLNNENAPQAVVQANVTSSQYQFPTSFVSPRRLMLSGKFSF
jgi:hypothetical protein